MPVTGGVTRDDYTASSGQTVFAYTFQVLSDSDLKVLKDGVELTLYNDYAVTSVGNINGGNIVLQSGATAGAKVSVLLAMPITRTTNYQNAGDFLALDVNADFDKAYLAMNQLETDIDRSIGLQDADTSANLKLPLEANRANKLLGFDASGDVIATAAGDVGGGEPLAQTLVLGNTTGGTDISVSSGDNIVMAASSTVDGRDVSVDGAKLDGIEAGADVTDTTNVVASLTAGSNITIAADGTIASTGGGNETLAQTLVLGNTTGGTDLSVSSGDNIVMAASSTVDGRDVSVDGTKLDGIEASADVTDTTNVVAALSAGTGISLSAGGEITNTSPDQTVALTGAGGTTVSGTYPNFTITSTGGGSGGETLAQTLVLGNATGGSDVAFGDNDKATFGAADDLEIFHDGSNSYVGDYGTGNLFVGGTSYVDIGNGIAGVGGQTYARFNTAGSCQLNYNGVDRLTTTNTGVDINGDISLGDNNKGTFGAADDLEIFHDGSNSYVADYGTGNLFIGGSSYVDIGNGIDGVGGQTYARFNTAGSCQLNYNGVDKLATTASGVDVNGTVEFNGLKGTGAVTITNILDEDNMASNSPTALATQQSIKAYVDSSGGGGSQTLAQTLVLGNTTGGTDIAFADNDKATFGANTDLEIYHDGSNSYVVDDGTGNLFIGGASYVDIGNGVSGAGGQTYARFNTAGSCQLNYNGVDKLATTSTGVEVNGNINVADNSLIQLGTSNDLELLHDGSNSYIRDTGTGNLFVGGAAYVDIGNGISGAGGQTYARFNTAGSCDLKHNNVQKMSTTATGIDVSGNVALTGTVDGRDVATDGTKLDTVDTNADVTDTANVTAAGALMDSEVTNLAQVKAFDSADYATAAQGTTADAALPKAGGALTGTLALGDNVKATFGAGDDLEIYHDGSNSYITDTGTGNLFVGGSSYVDIGNGVSGLGGQTYARFNVSGACQLNYNGVDKLKTISTGANITGSLGINTTSPSEELHVVGDIIATGNITAFFSDERLKDFQGTIPDALDKVNSLNGYYFTPNDTALGLGVEDKGVEVGISAQEVEAVLPEIVTDSAVGEGYKTVWYEKLTPLLIEAVKELTDKVDDLEERLKELEK
jgi:hypothetical protein